MLISSVFSGNPTTNEEGRKSITRTIVIPSSAENKVHDFRKNEIKFTIEQMEPQHLQKDTKENVHNDDDDGEENRIEFVPLFI